MCLALCGTLCFGLSWKNVNLCNDHLYSCRLVGLAGLLDRCGKNFGPVELYILIWNIKILNPFNDPYQFPWPSGLVILQGYRSIKSFKIRNSILVLLMTSVHLLPERGIQKKQKGSRKSNQTTAVLCLDFLVIL